MNTLTAGQIAHILDNIRDAERNMCRMLLEDGVGSRKIWYAAALLDLKFARDKLLRASLSDVRVERIPGSAADAGSPASAIPCHTPESPEVADPGRGAKFIPSIPAGQNEVRE